MKIYSSTEFIREPKVGDMQLEVISQWDFTTKPVCFGTIYEGKPNEATISYAIRLITEVGENRQKYQYVNDLPNGLLKELQDMGYELPTHTQLKASNEHKEQV